MNKKRLRSLFLMFLDTCPVWMGTFFSRAIVYIQGHKYIEEIRQLNKKLPCEHVYKNEKWNSILIVRLDALGDMLWTTSFIRELHCNFPTADIDLIARPVAKQLLENCPYISHVYEYNCKLQGHDNPLSYDSLRKVAKQYMDGLLVNEKKEYDVVFLPREVFLGNGIQNLYLAAYSKAPLRIGRGYATNAIERERSAKVAPFFSMYSQMTVAKHETLQILDMLKMLGCKIFDDCMEVWQSDIEKQHATEWYRRNNIPRNACLIAVGLEGSTPNRSWSIENYKKLFVEKTKVGAMLAYYVLLGTAQLSKENKELFIKMNHVIDMTRKTSIREMIGIISESTMYIGSDTGLMHVASACHKPVVEISAHFKDGRLMDSGSAVLVGPWGVDNVVLESDTGLDDCVGWCDKSYSHCINQITVKEVKDAIDVLIVPRR